MPQTRKRSGKRNMRSNPTTSVATRSTSSREPTSSIGRGATTRSREETSSTTRTAMKRRNTSACAPVQSVIVRVQLILVVIQIVKTTIRRNLTTPRLLRPISPRLSTQSSVIFLQKATAQGMTARMFHISVSILANYFFVCIVVASNKLFVSVIMTMVHPCSPKLFP